jgi:crotonobetainyl-CoA:carnitine CoA-transferase CaiB-like acyl-CoA transferase
VRGGALDLDHPQVLTEDLVTTLDHPAVGRYRTMERPIKFAGTPRPAPTATPSFGQHSEKILACYGYPTDEIAVLRRRGVVR